MVIIDYRLIIGKNGNQSYKYFDFINEYNLFVHCNRVLAIFFTVKLKIFELSRGIQKLTLLANMCLRIC